MGYLKAENIFPEELVKELQKYADGELVYIPRAENRRRPWGSRTDTKEMLSLRNQEIWGDYAKGVSVEALSAKYHLVPGSIQRILLEQKCGNGKKEVGTESES